MEVDENISLKPRQNDPQEILKDECEQIWEQIYETYSRIQARHESCPPKAIGINKESEEILAMILKAKEKKIKAEISVVQDTEITVPRKELQPDENQLKLQLANRASQLNETLLVVKNQKQDILHKLEREEEIFQQHKAIQESLQQKIRLLEMDKENQHSAHSEMKTLEEKTQKVEKDLSELVKKLGAFIKEHFPMPKIDESSEHSGPEQKYISLQKLLEELIKKLFDSPQDPYITIMPNHWPPYIELLLRCGIALRHKKDSNLIRLEAFQS